MATIGWMLILIALLIVRGVSRGRGLTEIPGDLSALFIALVSNDTVALRQALSQSGQSSAPTPPLTPDTTKLWGVSGGSRDVKPQPGTSSANAAERDSRANDPTDYGAGLGFGSTK